MELLNNMLGMLLSIEPAQMQQAQEELMESSKRASEGIKIMFNENRASTDNVFQCYGVKIAIRHCFSALDIRQENRTATVTIAINAKNCR
jgi:hypothetical protein